MNMAQVDIIVDVQQRVTPNMLDRAQVLAARLDSITRAWLKKDFRLPIVFHTSQVGSLEIMARMLAEDLMVGCNTNRVLQIYTWKVNESHIKIVHFDSSGAMYLIAELFEFDDCDDDKWWSDSKIALKIGDEYKTIA